MSIDLAKLVKGAATSRTLYAVAGLLGINLADPSGLDVRLWINGHIFDLGNLSPVISVGLAALAAWGRIKAAGPLVAAKETPTADTDEPKGFQRGNNTGGANG